MHPAWHEHARLSHSPQRTPQISPPATSPTKSVRPQWFFGHLGTTVPHISDFFDDTSEEDVTVGNLSSIVPDDHSNGPEKTANRISHAALASSEPIVVCERQSPRPGVDHRSNDPSTMGRPHSVSVAGSHRSLAGSVEELLGRSTQSAFPSFREDYTATADRDHAATKADTRNQQARLSKADHLLSAHAIAHEITLKALLRNEQTNDAENLLMETGQSFLTPSLGFSASKTSNAPSTSSKARERKVSIVAPPFNPGFAGPLPADIVRTPYPTIEDKRLSHTQVTVLPVSKESRLAISLRRIKRNGPPRRSIMSIPKPNDITEMKRADHPEKERHFHAMDYDDEELFSRLRKEYRKLCGPLWLFGARSLSNICVETPDDGIATEPQAKRLTIVREGDATLPEGQLLDQFKRPRLGRGKFHIVHRIHSLSSAAEEAAEHERDSMELGEQERPSLGLEFVLGWSIWRIVLCFTIVLLTSIAAALCWILLGKNTVDGPSAGGYRDAGDRVTAGVLMGVGTMILGFSCMGGWIGISWLLT